MLCSFWSCSTRSITPHSWWLTLGRICISICVCNWRGHWKESTMLFVWWNLASRGPPPPLTSELALTKSCRVCLYQVLSWSSTALNLRPCWSFSAFCVILNFDLCIWVKKGKKQTCPSQDWEAKYLAWGGHQTQSLNRQSPNFSKIYRYTT